MIVKNNRIRLYIFLFFLVFLIPSAHAEEELSVKEIVFEHIGDAYNWHIATVGEKEICIHLPVIVRGKNSGWHIFSSSRLSHGAEYNGFRIAVEGDYKGKIVERNSTGEEVRPSIDISFTKNVLGLWINCIVLLLVILPVARWYKRHTFEPPKGFRGAVEMLITNVQDELIKPCIGEDYRRYSPYLLTVFFFIFVNNVMGLIPFFPGGANITGNITITLFLALCTFLVVNFSGTKEYWKEVFWPDVPAWLKVPAPIMPLLEIFGVITKPFALMIRLFANIMAGHSVIISLVCVIFITVSMGVGINIGMSALSVVFTIFMNFVELLVAYIQAYVFTLLSAVFIGLAKVKHVKN
ncbi:F-type H+-transporting ATPase subunit a [Parabacteroides sp. PF5-5]|uniref:F0F1 ATP synthase subunit A n=1 Tax=unclassified Parabacteroides TaxID=2649774 RepID=UPI002476E314|nr:MULTISPECIES: F0F1 ATP synthase subunit A [unclassified Parabacteroides]MDH6304753.1 F-type H+-transporting ATPase subunit a [Parabacteroides sp. PH5-39]MDH6315632.1 F-type H+-transporting ATPase subunit a [Parabacteroides sp. PF5-13]MDH6319293.1 F-type H+-transporting ATPase subunit a [Parabacteroides sp. PH5-13]MDH6323024.1 F-type H+-transporting ATPase subunit a [Parabacteroides sp. PH5-8]MDH6326825.1 F-type H+-transporting ATPase subunit a [Parabacteroides sp. PH5-41]